MEKLIVKNFLVLKDIELEVNKINILIGEQAEGKSLIAKLVYFFEKTKEEFVFSIFIGWSLQALIKTQTKMFYDIFPSYILEKDLFALEYGTEDWKIFVFSEKLKSNKIKLRIKFSENIHKRYNLLKIKYNKSKELRSKEEAYNKFSTIKHAVKEKLFDVGEPIFIPAGRSFFANLQKRIFNFIKNDIALDFFIKEFGSNYEKQKGKFEAGIISQNIKRSIDKIVKGEYKLIKGEYEDYIFTNEKLIRLENTSSGQQEILPMLIVIATEVFDTGNLFINSFYFIEEPETHLYPSTQKKVVEFICSIFNSPKKEIENSNNDKKNSFFITTHSPYILSSFNNLIQADNAYKSIITSSSLNENKEELLKKLYKTVPRKKHISFEDISAYYLKNGKLKDIKNYENRLIDVNAIDDVSDEIGSEFDNLLNLEIGENDQ
ncbi:MAG: hypothetical protein B6D62_00280 [Candidatus Cloacimonas sp. 4484_275]|nr:MAG: hypothetical protein B6D62_00280 [Candidatus Cloacimonas sp. 4484_275]